jgi:hypothetical protein
VTAIMRVALPRAAALTDVLQSPPIGRVGESELQRLRDVLVSELTGNEVGAVGGAVRIDAYRLQLSLNDPGRLRDLDRSFNPNPAACRRSIGLAATTACCRDGNVPPVQAVRTLLAQVESLGGSGAWWEQWYRRLAPGAKGVVQAEATTWASQLFEALEWHRFDPQALLGTDPRWRPGSGSRVMLHGRVDVQVATNEVPAFLISNTGVAGPEWAAGLALPALAAGLSRGSEGIPGRVVGWWPASGQVRILEIDLAVLERTAKMVIDTAKVLRRVI